MAVHRPTRFIDDLVPLILASSEHWWPSDFVHLAVVSRAWLIPVQRRLYAAPTLASFRACRLFARTLDRNPSLLPFIHGMDICPVAMCEVADGWPMCHDTNSLRRLLNIHGLTSLRLGGELAVAAERFLRSLASAHTITELHIDGSKRDTGTGQRRYISPSASLEWDHTTTFRFPNLRKFTLSHLELNIEPPSVSYCLKLEEVTMDRVDIVSGWLHHLAHGSWHHLRTLTIKNTDPCDLEEQVKLVLECCTDSLTSLRYEIDHDSVRDIVFESMIVPCSTLRELRISGVHVSAFKLSDLALFFPSLVTLSVFGRSVHVAPSEWVMFLHSGALPTLRDLHIPNGHGPPFTRWTEGMHRSIQDAGALKNVRVHKPSHRL
ncbi:hypothetical protein BD410DRAFT_780854 [Rickenella mellea]|uniref:F-box domain-containing protein n=1 Tax=Rickenella mellea TaxID=50990 RepID=A0A4Y7QLW8_9AGAM|nr:hypothetical protein BD410DRAFT_780854 [Rickenella mellea]